MLADLFKTLLGWLWASHGDRRRLRVTVHQGFFEGSAEPHLFVNLTNLSRSRELEVTHVWFDCRPQIPVHQPSRPLPRRLRPDETWETWLPLMAIPAGERSGVHGLGRARLSTGAVVRSVRNRGVPDSGAVPGGPVRHR